jgi:hypothetical protein
MGQYPDRRQSAWYSESMAEQLFERIGPLPSVESHRRIAGSPPAAPSLEYASRRPLNRVFYPRSGISRLQNGSKLAGSVYRSVNGRNS